MTLAVQEAASLMNSLNSRACVLRLEAQGYQRQSSMLVVWWASLVQEGPTYVVNPLLGLELLSKHCQIVTQDQRGSEQEIRY